MPNFINRCLRRTPFRPSLEESKQNELTHENEREIPLQAEHSERLERTPQTIAVRLILTYKLSAPS